jgi:deoxyribodipyrimidine photo-lyase
MNEVLKNNGSSMYILNDKPLEAFKKICKQFNVKQVLTNHDYEPYAIERDEDIRIFLAGQGIPFTTYKDQVIFEKSEVVKADGTPYTVFPPYSKVWRRKYSEQKPESFPSEDMLLNMVKTKPFHFPSLKDIGFEHVEMPGFDTSINEETILRYHETRNLPGIAGTSHISVHLRFGTVSVRHLIGLAARLNENWLTELMWREYFMMILFHFPRVVTRDFKEKFNHIQWRNNRDEFKRWCRGETGYPIVDAGMRELNETGWMHNRVRLITAGFLVKHLLIDWRWGDDYFGQKLLDYELSSNNGNWQWIAVAALMLRPTSGCSTLLNKPKNLTLN